MGTHDKLVQSSERRAGWESVLDDRLSSHRRNRADLLCSPKSTPWKVENATALRRRAGALTRWIAGKFSMGSLLHSPRRVSHHLEKCSLAIGERRLNCLDRLAVQRLLLHVKERGRLPLAKLPAQFSGHHHRHRVAERPGARHCRPSSNASPVAERTFPRLPRRSGPSLSFSSRDLSL